ncbi:MAG TPA: hypothetical protein VK636_17555 [Gemmatimonadaceae bacterium]|nr:hypothetical protein [Gemmatimonadaceae bacterium]
MLDALPDDGHRYEIIDGELYPTPCPSDVHQYIVGELLIWTNKRDQSISVIDIASGKELARIPATRIDCWKSEPARP